MPAGRGARGDHGYAFFFAKRDEKTFAARTINGIQYEIKPRRKQLLCIGLQKEGVNWMGAAIGIDCFHAGRHHFHFWFAQFAIQGMKLTIHVADADVVQINQRQLTDARSGQCFYGP
jgi:hypothetical protein